MQWYLARRLFYAILVLLAVSLLTFFMSTVAPGDRVNAHLTLDGNQTAYAQQPFFVRTTEYKRSAERLGAHLPFFYFSIQPRCFPDTLTRIVQKEERQALKTLLLRHGQWDNIAQYHAQIINVLQVIESLSGDPSAPWRVQVSADAEFLLTTADTGRIHYLLQSMARNTPAEDSLSRRITVLNSTYEEVRNVHAGLSQLLPSVHWHGLQNQYHQWITKTLSGDLGRSLIDGRPVNQKIHEALRWTLSINIIAILLAFGIAIPLGVSTARRVGKPADKIVSSVLFAFYAIPSFWLAMLCIVFLTTSEYSTWLDLFPTAGVGMVSEGMSFGTRLGIRISHLTLPVFCVLAGSLAYLTRQMRGSVLRELRQDYIRMARAKGLSERTVYWRHAFRNALFPMITMVGSAIPAVISGAVILEVIFSIPGMGRLLYMSILSKDWPVVYAMVLLAAGLTVIGYLCADLLYRWADPRVSFYTRKS